MKQSIEIYIRTEDFPSKLINEFCAMFPFGKKGAGFHFTLPPDDLRLKEVLVELERRGITKVDYSRRDRLKEEYIINHHRTYEPSDFDGAHYLQLRNEVLVSEDQKRDEQGRLIIEKRLLRPGLRIGCVLFNATVVSGKIREEMLSERLAGVQFREVMVEERTDAEHWELVSTVLLPPMPHERLVCRPGTPDDYLNVAGIVDGDFFEKEIHYSTAAVQQIEPFDFGLTHEVFGGERWPVASQRFRQFCVARKLEVSWVPVRLDPG